MDNERLLELLAVVEALSGRDAKERAVVIKDGEALVSKMLADVRQLAELSEFDAKLYSATKAMQSALKDWSEWARTTKASYARAHLKALQADSPFAESKCLAQQSRCAPCECETDTYKDESGDPRCAKCDAPKKKT